MPTYKTPDVYVEEIPVFPPSVAEVGTAIPAFVGNTKTAKKKADDDLLLVPTKIYSFNEFEQYFGGPPADPIVVTARNTEPDATKPKVFVVEGYSVNGSTAATPPPPTYLLYWSVKLYFDNGGGQCYIVSTGDYGDALDADKLIAGLGKVRLEDEPTLLVVPDAIRLATYAGYLKVVQDMLKQCGELKDRFAILDLYGGDKALSEDAGGGEATKIAEANRNAWNANLKYGASYYPFLKTSINDFVAADEKNVTVKMQKNDGSSDGEGTLDTLENQTQLANTVKAALKDHFVTAPPSGAVAGVYAAVDGARGVWKAPANVALASVLEPVVKIDNTQQEGLNVDPSTGKSINAIRAFAGKGTLIWGARTLLGNDNEWRYINVRRFFNMVEESSKKSSYWAVFEPNDANLWVKVRGMLENYLIDKWREGALAGAAPKDAFYVKCGLGTTMTPQDILEGRLNVEIGMAVVRPAEFIVLKFSHKLQTS